LSSYKIKKYYNKNRTHRNFDTHKDAHKNEVPVNREFGYIEIYITKNLGTEAATDSELTIYVTNNGDKIPVTVLSPTQNPTLIKLPIAHPSGALVEGPEYLFTPYNLTIESEGYYRVITQNIRLFPNIKSTFFYNLNEIVAGEPNREEITVIPAHPRDIVP